MIEYKKGQNLLKMGLIYKLEKSSQNNMIDFIMENGIAIKQLNEEQDKIGM
jgi:hypothetical protein